MQRTRRVPLLTSPNSEGGGWFSMPGAVTGGICSMRKVDAKVFCQDVDTFCQEVDVLFQGVFPLFDSGVCTLFTEELTFHLGCCRFTNQNLFWGVCVLQWPFLSAQRAYVILCNVYPPLSCAFSCLFVTQVRYYLLFKPEICTPIMSLATSEFSYKRPLQSWLLSTYSRVVNHVVHYPRSCRTCCVCSSRYNHALRVKCAATHAAEEDGTVTLSTS